MNNINISRDKFLVFGAGVSGRSAFKLLTSLGAQAVIIEGDGPECILEFDVMILSPGISRDHRLVQLFIAQDKPVLGELELASRYIKSPILCVTGSNGKTTVCTMMADFLNKLGHHVFLGGNIGTPLSEAALKELNGECFDYIICEASSFQLESLSQFKADVSVLLNLSFTHQERYQKFDDYIAAKLNLIPCSRKFIYCSHPKIESDLAQKQTEMIELRSRYQFGYEFMQLVGEHNKQNFESCFQILQAAGVEFSAKQAQTFIQCFQAPEFRVQRVAVKKNLIFYNDSKSTNLESTLAAIDCFKDKEVILVLGGKVRDAQLSHFQCLNLKQLNSLHVFGEASKHLADLENIVAHDKLDDVFNALEKETLDKNKVYHILFSPGFPSLDQYRNYLERGEHFNTLVDKVII